MADHDVYLDLDHEQARLEEILAGLDDSEWKHPSGCAGWSIRDVVLHLAQTEEGVAAVTRGRAISGLALSEVGGVDDLMAQWVESERDVPTSTVFDRWRQARRAALEGLREADPATPLPWVAAPLKPRTLATTRLSEHWIHSLDITGPLGIPYPDTERLWHIARLAHRTLHYAFAGEGLEAPEVRVELLSSGGDTWTFGEEGAPTQVEGEASEFCRVAGRRLHPKKAQSLRSEGPSADDVLRLLRTYA